MTFLHRQDDPGQDDPGELGPSSSMILRLKEGYTILSFPTTLTTTLPSQGLQKKERSFLPFQAPNVLVLSTV